MPNLAPLLNQAASLSLQDLKNLQTSLSTLIEEKERKLATINQIKELAKIAGLSLQDILGESDDQVDHYLSAHDSASSKTESPSEPPVVTEVTSSAKPTPVNRPKPTVAKPRTSKVKASKTKPAKIELPPSRYRHPTNPVQEWTGFGAKPAWIKKFLDEGGVLADLEVRQD